MKFLDDCVSEVYFSVLVGDDRSVSITSPDVYFEPTADNDLKLTTFSVAATAYEEVKTIGFFDNTKKWFLKKGISVQENPGPPKYEVLTTDILNKQLEDQFEEKLDKWDNSNVRVDVFLHYTKSQWLTNSKKNKEAKKPKEVKDLHEIFSTLVEAKKCIPSQPIQCSKKKLLKENIQYGIFKGWMKDVQRNVDDDINGLCQYQTELTLVTIN
ncbi:hypothetical protein K501DRAFT_279132 [Backusella circina FSU 941]|nr:hypothetical protein K501DRAFT_279132 [Backusella circina FSU 941]